MSSFNTIVIIVAVVILVISLIAIGIMIYLNQFKKAFPPVVADCPDYWLDKSNGNASKCVNVKKIGKKRCPKIMNFSRAGFQGKKGLCRKYKWARRCDITWDGISQLEDPCSKNT